jgi:hypothetical protein
LTETSAVKEGWSGCAIDKHTRGRRPKQQHKPPDPPGAEPPLPQHTQEKGPRDAIEGSSHVQLEEERRHLLAMQQKGGLLHKDKVVVNTSSANESTLVAPHKLDHPRRQPKSHHFGD